MQVGVNLAGLPSTRQGGAGLYAATLIRGLVDHPRTRTVVLCSNEVERELSDVKPHALVYALPDRHTGRAQRLWELGAAFTDPRRYDAFPGLRPRLAGCSVVHYPLSFMSGPVHEAASVVTAVDIQHLAFPHFFSHTDRLLRSIRWHRSWLLADRLIVFSDFVRRSLVDRLGLSPDRIDTVHAACHPSFYEPVHAGYESGQDASPEDGPFFFYPAAPLPAKNHRRMLEAFREIRRLHPDVSVVLSGPTRHDWTSVERAVSELRLGNRVKLKGNLPLSVLRAHYRHAVALVFPSLYEGFGIPLVEAMASGCPVAASATASIPEVVSDAAIFFDPLEPASIVDTLMHMLELSPAERDGLIAKGKKRSLGFTPERMVAATLGTYSRAGRAGPPG